MSRIADTLIDTVDLACCSPWVSCLIAIRCAYAAALLSSSTLSRYCLVFHDGPASSCQYRVSHRGQAPESGMRGFGIGGEALPGRSDSGVARSDAKAASVKVFSTSRAPRSFITPVMVISIVSQRIQEIRILTVPSTHSTHPLYDTCRCASNTFLAY